MEERIWEVGEGVRCAECTRLHDVHPRTSVVVQSRSEVETSEPMMGPCRSAIRALMHHYKLSRGVNGVGRKINVFAVDAGVSRDGRVGFGGAEVIDSEDGYGKKKVPEISGKGGVDSS